MPKNLEISSFRNLSYRVERITLFSDGQRIVGVLHLPSDEGKFPCIITCHGYNSTKDSGKYITIANRLCKEGFSVFRFDFRGCGESEGNIEETTLSGRVKDLEAALQFLKNHVHISDRMGLLGSSFGGYIAILRAVKGGDIRAVVAWSTPSSLSVLSNKGKLHEENDLLEVVKKVTTPILIIHGEKDELIPLYLAKCLFESANEPKLIKIIKGGDHKLTDPSNRDQAIEQSLKWFKKYV